MLLNRDGARALTDRRVPMGLSLGTLLLVRAHAMKRLGPRLGPGSWLLSVTVKVSVWHCVRRTTNTSHGSGVCSVPLSINVPSQGLLCRRGAYYKPVNFSGPSA
jgi:hypothetical protein